ncbi:hypothetical protein HDU97_000646 [Phlyctochytrium planicorne]|nr:hypothetical protein HDU97_000646 [Phlyctochytrium planicorne]
MQHAIVNATEATEGAKVVVYYKFNSESVILRDRFPWYIHLAREIFGEEAILLHGRLNLRQLEDMIPDFSPSSEVFWKMVERRFLLSIEPSFVFVDKTESDAAAAAAEAEDFLATKSSSKRKATEPIKETSSKLARMENTFSIDQMKAKYTDSFFAVNHAQFHVYFCTKSLAKAVGQKQGAPCEGIIKAFLSPVQGDQIGSDSITNRDDIPASFRNSTSWISDYLDILLRDDTHILMRSEEKGGFRIDILRFPFFLLLLNHCIASDFLKKRVVEAYIQEKFGVIAKVAMVTNQNARQNLYKLFQHGMVLLQEVPRTLDHASSRTYYLWFVSLGNCVQTLEEISYHTCLNLKLRRVKELSDNHALIEKSQRSDVVEDPTLLTQPEQDGLKHFENQTRMLRISELRIKRLLPQFEDKHLRIFYHGRQLEGDDSLEGQPHFGSPSLESNSRTLYMHCAVSESLNPSSQLGRQENPEPSRGFDRLLEIGFSVEEVDNLRTQFHNIRGTNTHMDFESVRNAEEEWIDNSAIRNREPESEGSMVDVVIGVMAGFFLGVLVLFWIKEQGFFTRRQQMGIIAGLFLNISYGILRMK